MEIRRFIATFAIVLLSAVLPTATFAAQTAEVISEDAGVYEGPRRSTPLISNLKKGTMIYASSEPRKDSRGGYWFKVRLPEGQIGYISAVDLKTAEFVRDLQESQIQPHGVDTQGESFRERRFSFRAMGLVGGELKTSALDYGGEAEFTYFLPISGMRSYLKRWLAVGGAYLNIVGLDPIYAGTMVVNLAPDSRLRPEFRLRLGRSASLDLLQGGVNLGMNYSLSEPRIRDSIGLFSVYAEMGSIAKLGLPFFHLWGSFGLGVHF